MSDEPQASETPLPELLRDVPRDYRAEWPFQFWPDGTPSGHAMAPVGLYCHRAADEIDRLKAENKALRWKVEYYKQYRSAYHKALGMIAKLEQSDE